MVRPLRRQRRRERGVHDSGLGADAVEHRVEHPLGLGLGPIARDRRGELHGERVVRAVAQRAVGHRLEAAHRDDGPREHGERERHLGGDEEAAQAVSPAALGAAPPGGGERLLRIGAARHDRRHRADDERGRERHDDGERQHRAVDTDPRPAWIEAHQLRGEQRAQTGHAPHGEQRAHDPAHRREDQRLGELEADDAGARRAERDANGDLARPRHGAGEEQIGNVRAGEEQHERHGGELGEHVRPRMLAVERVCILDAHVPLVVVLRILALQLLHDGMHVGVGTADRQAGREPRQHAGEHTAVALAAEVAVERERRPELGARRKDEPRRHDTDDGARHVVDANDASQHLRVRAEVAAPHPVAQDDDVRRLGVARVVIGERATQRGTRAQQMEVARRDAIAVYALRLLDVGDAGLEGPERGQLAEALVAARQVDVVRGRHEGVVRARVRRRDFGDEDETSGIGGGDRVEDQRAGEAVDARRAADAEREADDRGGGETFGAKETARGEAKVGEHESSSPWKRSERQAAAPASISKVRASLNEMLGRTMATG